MANFQTHMGELAAALIDIIKKAGLTSNVWIEHGPELDKNVPDDFCIVTFPPSIRNKGPYQTHDVRVEFVCKDLPTGRTDLLKLEEKMVNPFLRLFPITAGRHTMTKPWVRMKGSDRLGHSSWAVQCDCLVNTVDNAITY